MLAEALSYAAAGLKILPLDGKRPVGRLAHHGARSATIDPATLRAWWHHGDHNIGAIVPAVHVVLDVDPRNGGDASLKALLATYGPLPPTLCVRTGGGGWHYWFRHPDAHALSSRVVPGLDVKRPGGYVVMPPSVHPESGRSYEWADETVAVAGLPGWLGAVMLPTEHARTVDPSVTMAAGAARPRRGGLTEEAWSLLEGRGTKTWGDTTASGVFWS